MNKGLFRLVFSVRQGRFVPVAEFVAACAGRSSGSRARRRRALVALLAAAVQGAPALAEQPAGLVPHAALGWANAGIASSSASQMTIQQTAPKAILNWQQLNLGRGQTLAFDQGGNRAWAALNRIHDANPSIISGNVRADGHIYLINGNGIIFGNGAQINVGSLTATTLDVTDSLFNSGNLSDPANAVFGGTGGFVRVEQGAALSAATGGRVMLLAKDVTNHGVISTPDGQTILAAGEKVYLADSTDPAGLLVEVDSGGTAINLGEIVAQRGNVTLVGLAVNQEGRISASTSVRANGSIHLLARDTVDTATLAASGTLQAKRGGVVTLGKDSTTTVEVEAGDKEEVLDAQVLAPSRVQLSGGVIDIEGSIIAHGGEVTAVAAFNPSLPDNSGTTGSAIDTTRIYLGKDASIDVSGIDASAPMSRNQLEIQLYSDQLKDAPLQRGGPLFGKVIYVDAGKGTALTDIAPYLALKGKTIAERLASGGSVKLAASSGEVVLHAGSELNVSGGSVGYEAGYLRESTLSYQGKTVAVSQADPNIPYQKLADTYSVTDPKWGVTRSWVLNSGRQAELGVRGAYRAAYRTGSKAGTINVEAVNAVLQADLKAATRPGTTQRNNLPAGGTFDFTKRIGDVATIRVVAENSAVLPDDFAAAGEWDVVSGKKFAAGDALPEALKSEILLDTRLFANGFDHLKLDGGNGNIVVDAAIKTGPGGSLDMATAGKATLNADITLPGGDLSVKGGITEVADGVIVSTAGLFTNDIPGLTGAMTAPVAVDGGNVAISGIFNNTNSIAMGPGARIDAGAGAWLGASGKLVGGKGGNVTLNGAGELLQGQVQSFGFNKGGKLAINTYGDAQIGGQHPAAAGTLWLSEPFFGQSGFSAYSINTSTVGSRLLVGDDAGSATVIHPRMQTLVARSGFAALASGTPMADVAHPVLPVSSLRVPVSLAFNSGGNLAVSQNALIQTDAPGSSAASSGSIALAANRQLTILGSLIAPAGKISATIGGGIGFFAFDNTLSLFVGESARLLATGYYAVPPSSGGNLVNANVLGGGTIKLDGGDRGVVVTREGSLLDVSGASGQVDIANSSGYTRQSLYSPAGNINISSRNGLVLDGDLSGNATGTGAGGTLSLNITGSMSDDPTNVHPNDARALTVTQNKSKHADGLNAGDALDSVIGQGAISAEQIAAGGFDRLVLGVGRDVPGDRIVLPGGLDLKLPAALTLDAALLEASGGSAQVAAPHITLTNNSSGVAAAPGAGNATLEINADFIDLVNAVNVAGVARTQLSARQDIRGRVGSLLVPGELVLSARQIYPATNSALFFEAVGAGSRIEVQSSGQASAPVLSAGGHLKLKADEIVQGGVLRAPLGDITLDAANKLTLRAGSLTSVSTDGLLIPYGLTGLGGLDWFAPGGQLVAEDRKGITALPEKRIKLQSADIALQAGATVDISGGGDVLAYEFIQGIGGTRDILGQAGVYAVMPSMQDQYAPFDSSYHKTVNPDKTASPLDTNLKPGDAIYLSGVPGLAAGVYTLLPGRYALLPGAFMVQEAGKTRLRQGQSVSQPDGSDLASGYRTTLSDTSVNRDSKWDTFRITDGKIFHPAKDTISRAPAEYRLTTGNQFFRQLALDEGSSVQRLASDAGQLTLDAGTKLALDAAILTDSAVGARGALVDIVSGRISVVSAIGAENGTLQLTADALNALHAESLLLGGTRTHGADGMSVATNAGTVTFANDAAHVLEVPELIAVAKDTLTVNSGAAISTLATTQPTGTTRLHASGDGALLAVSALNDLEFDRTGVSVSPASGTLDIAAGATVRAGHSLVLDSTLASALSGNIDVSAGGSATLGANRILLGDSGNETGLKLDDAAIASLGDVARLTLNSRSNVDIYGPVSFGNGEINLTVNAGGIAGHLADNQVAALAANNFVLENSAGAAYAPPAGAAGSMEINANSITFAGKKAANVSANAGNTTLGGFAAVNLNATGDITFRDSGSAAIQSAQTNITGTRISAATGADYTLAATGALTTAKAADAAAQPDAGGLGARLKMVAASMALGGNVEMSSGQFTARVTAGDLTVAEGASIKAASVPVKFDRFTGYTPGGMIALQADQGNVNVFAGAELDVSGGVGADAGAIKIFARQGQATVAGLLKGQAATGHQAGSFVSDSKTLSGFSGLNSLLNGGGFTHSREMRIRTGDVEVAAADTVTADRFVLSADTGSITIAGTVDADGASGGSIGLYAGNGVTLTGTAALKAAATEAGARGGRVEVATLAGALDFQAGSSIDVSGGASGGGGEIHLRAPRNAANTDINITALAGTVSGASEFRAEGFKTYAATSITTSSIAKTAATSWYKEAESFMKSALVNSGVGLNRLGMASDPLFTIVPGIEIRNTAGDLALANDWTLHDWRFDPVSGAGTTSATLLAGGVNASGKPLLAGALTLRASGNLAMNGTLSDGFSSAALTTANTAQGLSAWSYNLAGGADFGAANYLDTAKAASTATGNISLANSKGIRTGAGDIRMASGGNLTLGNDASVIYTAGRKADALPWFNNPANALYLNDGGNVEIHARGNITGALGAGNKQQLVNNWLFRAGGGTQNRDVTWWVRPDLFKQGVAAFGGGGVEILADGNITNFSASVPTTARYDSYTVTTATDPDTGAVSSSVSAGSGSTSVAGGGNLLVQAGGNIYSGVYQAGRGKVRLTAGGEIGAAANSFGTTLALQDADAEVSAAGNALIETVFNPTLFAQASANSGTPFGQTGRIGSSPYFMTYAEGSTFRLNSLTGNATLGLAKTANITQRISGMNGSMGASAPALEIHPATVEAIAFNGDINVGRLVLAPAARGNLSLLAAGDVKAVSGSDGMGLIAVSDADPGLLPGVLHPLDGADSLGSILPQFRSAHAATPLHGGDEQPLSIVARDGSILLAGEPGLTSPKAVFIHAGLDVSLNADLQHLSGNDISVVEAGRDFASTTRMQPLIGGKVLLGGPGELLVQAGRDVSLGKSRGIVTAANTINPALPDGGASITVLAGLGKEGANLADYVGTYINPAGSGPLRLQGDSGKLAQYRQQTAQAVTAYMRKLSAGNHELPAPDAMAQYLALDADRQAVFAYRHFSSELLASGKGFAESKNHDRGDDAIAALFPAGRKYDGDLLLFNSQLRTLHDGSIDMLTPGGSINAGVPTSSGENIGIVTERGGDIRAFAEAGFQVEQSRVITQYGSDITVWVNNGDIDAGRGSKSAVSVPARVVSTDADGNTIIEVKGVATGSGIRAQTYDPDGSGGMQRAPALGSVALIAPRGILNAGEAGIAAGNFLAVATQVLGADNIQVSGSSTGVPLADAGSLAGSLAGVSNAAPLEATASGDMARQVPQASSPNNFLPSFISVEVIGLGDNQPETGERKKK